MKCPLRKNIIEVNSVQGNEDEEKQTETKNMVVGFCDCYQEQCMAYQDGKCMMLISDN